MMAPRGFCGMAHVRVTVVGEVSDTDRPETGPGAAEEKRVHV